MRLPSCRRMLYAPMCWVIPPASPSITLVLRRRSRSEVLPWSTCPMTVTIGGRVMRSSSRSTSSSCVTASTTSALTKSVLYPNSSATISIVSASRRMLIETMSPILIHVAMTCVTGTSIMLARSLTVTNSVSLSVRLSASLRSCASRAAERAASRLSLRCLADFAPCWFLPVSLARVSLT